MSLALDTSVLIDIEKENQATIKSLRDILAIHPLFPQLPFISYFEFLVGIKIRKPHKYQEIVSFFNKFNILHTTNKTIEILTELKIKYDRLGISLSLADLLIASQVIENQLILVTKDKDFEKIEEIKKIIL